MSFYFEYQPQVTSANNINPLMVVSYLRVFCDEGLTDYLTEIPFPSFKFEEVSGMTKEQFDAYVQAKVVEETNKIEWQSKLNELCEAKQLGLYIPSVPYEVQQRIQG